MEPLGDRGERGDPTLARVVVAALVIVVVLCLATLVLLAALGDDVIHT